MSNYINLNVPQLTPNQSDIGFMNGGGFGSENMMTCYAICALLVVLITWILYKLYKAYFSESYSNCVKKTQQIGSVNVEYESCT